MGITWRIDERVQVSLPYGADDQTVHLATVARIQEPGPRLPDHTVKVIFDDPLVYGGTGAAWVTPESLSLVGHEPARLNRAVTDDGYVIG